MTSVREISSDMEAASVLTAISSSPIRVGHRPSMAVERSPPSSPFFASFQDTNKYGNHVALQYSSLCDTPVPVSNHLPLASPAFLDVNKNVLSPLPVGPDALGKDDQDAMSKLLTLKNTPTSQRKRPSAKKLFSDREDDASEKNYPLKLNFSEPPVSPHSSSSQPAYEPPTVEVVSSSSSSSLRNPPLDSLAELAETGEASPKQPKNPNIVTPRAIGIAHPKTPQSQTASGKRKSAKRITTSSAKVSSQEVDDEDDEEEEEIENDSDSPKPCKCKRSRCLKLYCDCFGADRYCTKSCTCQECQNTDRPEHQAARDEAVQQTLERNPNAFTSKITETSNAAQHAKGCNCKRSGCLKKYCECFAHGVRCSSHCKCSGCENYTGSASLTIKPASPAPVGSATKSTGGSSKKKRPLSAAKSAGSPRRSARKRLDLQSANGVENEEAEIDITQDQVENGDAQDGLGRGYPPQMAPVHLRFALASKAPEISHPASFSDLDDMVGEQSMDSVFFSSQETKGSLSSRRPPKAKRMINWGSAGELDEDLTAKCLMFLETADLLRAALVSIGFAEVATSPNIWQYPESSQSTQGSQ